jgi:hypothetical protein
MQRIEGAPLEVRSTVSSTVELFDERLPLAGMRYGPQGTRMIVAGIGGGALLAVSPGRIDEAAFREIEALGTPRLLLAPNHFHNAGLALWKARYPEARLFAHPTAQPRLRRKVPGATFEDTGALAALLPSGFRLFASEQARQGEVTLSMPCAEGRAWFVTDAIVNEIALPGGLLRVLFLLMGFRTGLRVNPFFKLMALKDRGAWRELFLEELARDPPALFVPSHGAPLRGEDIAARLVDAVRAM